MAKFLNNAPYTDEGAKLELTAEQEENCKVVYKLDDKGGAAFAEFWNPKAEYTDEYLILPLRSTFDTTEDLTKGQAFANVSGSTVDPKPAPGSWIGFYESKVAPCNSCCAEPDTIYNSAHNKIDGTVYFSWYEERTLKYSEQTFTCGCRPSNTAHFGIVGGHVLKGTDSRVVPLGSNDVYLLPICDHHNSCQVNRYAKWGVGYYTKLAEDTTAVKLKGYLQAPQLAAMLCMV